MLSLFLVAIAPLAQALYPRDTSPRRGARHTRARGRGMKRLLFIASIMTVISGCAYEYEQNTYLRYSNISALEQAVSDDDIGSMKMWLREMPGYTKISDHQAIETAYERVSQKIYLDLVDEDSGASYLI